MGQKIIEGGIVPPIVLEKFVNGKKKSVKSNRCLQNRAFK